MTETVTAPTLPSAGPAPRVRRAWSSRRSATIAIAAALPLLILLVWHVSTDVLELLPPHKLQSPASVFTAAIELIQRGELGIHIAISTQRVLVGFLFGSVLGLILGAAVGLSRVSSLFFGGTLSAIRAVPSLAWVPLLLIWIGFGETSKITLIAIGAFFPVYTTVASALRHVDKNLVEAGRAFGLSGIKLLTTVQLPAVVPSVLSGLRLALAQAWLFLVAAELLGASMGLGFLLNDSGQNGRVDRLLLSIVLLAVLGIITDSILGIFERLAIKKWA